MPPKPYASIQTITSQPKSHIIKALRALCHDDKFREKTYLYLGKLSRHEKLLKEENAKADAIEKTSGSKKRDYVKSMIDVEICVQCWATFHEDENHEKSCFHHTEEMEEDLDSDVWVDWDERCHGPIDTEINRKSFPDGFMYSCCGEDGTSKGCTWGEHKTAEDPEDVQKAHLDRYMAAVNAAKRAKLNSGAAAAKKAPAPTPAPAPAVVNPPLSKPLKCVQCGIGFYETGNTERSCDYHDGEAELDQDAEVWADMQAHLEFSDVDTPEGRKDYPDGFKYTCCGRTLGEAQKGCKQGKHKAAESKAASKVEGQGEKEATTSKKVDSEDKENQPREVIEISDDSE